jgi:hypothetical protein
MYVTHVPGMDPREVAPGPDSKARCKPLIVVAALSVQEAVTPRVAPVSRWVYTSLTYYGTDV